MTSKKIQNITPESYVFHFGKYKDMKAVDIAQIYTVDKDGNSIAKGLMYLEWICEKDWFKHSDIIQKIIDDAKQNMSDEEEPKPEPKKKKEMKKEKKSTVKISQEDNVVDF